MNSEALPNTKTPETNQGDPISTQPETDPDSSRRINFPYTLIEDAIRVNRYVQPARLGHIELPILTIETIEDDGQDLRDQLPPEMLKGLPADCRIVYIRDVEIALPLPQYRIGSHDALMKLCGVNRLEDVGDNGAPNAAVSLAPHDKDPALHRFEAVHGRDALDIAMRLGSEYPKLLRNTIISLAQTQGVTNEEFVEDESYGQEEVGRIILVDRDDNDPVAQKFSRERSWRFPFYGSTDATLNYINAISDYAKNDPTIWDVTYAGRDGDSTIRDSYNKASDWLMEQLKSNSGFVEFKNKDPRPGKGLDCQSWRDSDYAYIHKDGSRANVKDGIASFDIQVFAHQALLNAANNASTAEMRKELSDKAEIFRQKTIETFWVEAAESPNGGYFALGADHNPDTGDLRVMDVKTSSMAAGLSSTFLCHDSPEEQQMIESTVKNLMSEELLYYNGLRTMANDEKGYAPTNYHTGSGWSHDTANAADTLSSQGFHYLAMELRARNLRTKNETGLYLEFTSGEVTHSEDGTVCIEIPYIEAYAYSDAEKALFLFAQVPQIGQGWVIADVVDAHTKAAEFIARPPAMLRFEQEIYENLSDRATNL